MPQQSLVKKKPLLIINTNIVSYRVQPWTENQLKTALEHLQNNYTLTISKITRYEILKSAQVKKESSSLKLLNIFESFDVTEKVLIVAALLYRFLKGHQDKTIQDPDLIIAATAFLNSSFIITVNRSDFPYPYFEEVTISPILYKRTPHKTDCFLLGVLKPNIQLIKREIIKIIDQDSRKSL